MKATIELKPDQLAQLVAAVFESNGFAAHGLSLHLGDELVGFDRAVVHYEASREIQVHQRPLMSRAELNQMLNPHAGPPATIIAE